MSAERLPVSILIEFPADDLPSGLARRYEHIVDVLVGGGSAVSTIVLHTNRPRRETGVRTRLRSARAVRSRFADVPVEIPCVVVGLGTPTMLVAARRLYGTGRRVVFDECDSVLHQLAHRLRTLDPRLISIVLWQLALRLTLRPGIGVTYISQRDEMADRSIALGRRVFVVPPTAPDALRRLPPVRYPLDRIVVPVELASHHTRLGFRMLTDAIRTRTPPVPVHLYGPTPPAEPLPAGATYQGYAARLEDVYDGDTAVVILNTSGSGVPNKLVEAAAAGRPVLLHRSLLGRWPTDGAVWVFDDASALSDALDRVVTGDSPSDPLPETDTTGHDAASMMDFLSTAHRTARRAAA